MIFENCYLTEDKIIRICPISNQVGADWAKTSTGYGTGGAEKKDIRLMRTHCKPE